MDNLIVATFAFGATLICVCAAFMMMLDAENRDSGDVFYQTARAHMVALMAVGLSLFLVTVGYGLIRILQMIW